MLHNQVAINVSAAIQAKGTAKSNAQLNFFSTNLMVRVNIDLMCRKWRAKENKLQSDGTWTTTCHYKYTDKGHHCHILASHALECCIMFPLSSETWNGDLWNPQNHFENDPNKNFSKRVQENAHVALWKYWSEIKIKPILLGAHRYLFWAFGINA